MIRASAVSFAAGPPGRLAMAAAAPIDMAQFFWHAVAQSQKPAYLYGWPDLLGRNRSVDEERCPCPGAGPRPGTDSD